MNTYIGILAIVATFGTICAQSPGAVTTIPDDFSKWQSAAGSFATVDFTGFQSFTIIRGYPETQFEATADHSEWSNLSGNT